jgi:hypothetical protein
MLTGKMNRGKTEVTLREAGYKVVAVMFFGKKEVARFPTLEQAEWRAKELNEHSERNPCGYLQYLVRPVEEHPKDG